MSNQIVKYVKETFVIKFMKGIFCILLISVIANAFFLGRYVSSEKQIENSQKIIIAIAIENNKLKVERDQALANYMHTKAKLNSAIIPEATFKDAASVHIVQPTKEIALNAYNVTREGISNVGEFVKLNVARVVSYVE